MYWKRSKLAVEYSLPVVLMGVQLPSSNLHWKEPLEESFVLWSLFPEVATLVVEIAANFLGNSTKHLTPCSTSF